MARKQLYIDDRHERDLKRRASEFGVSEAELVRRALGLTLQGESAPRLLHPERVEAARHPRRRWSAPSTTLIGRVERAELYDARLERLGRRDQGSDDT